MKFDIMVRPLEVLVVVVVDHLQVERQVGVMQTSTAPLIVAWEMGNIEFLARIKS